jgi:hypothetical protein
MGTRRHPNSSDRLADVDDQHRSVLDINPLNTIASHISYWSDEDVSHFILSQLLANRDRESKR